jgi:hypothetical protein
MLRPYGTLPIGVGKRTHYKIHVTLSCPIFIEPSAKDLVPQLTQGSIAPSDRFRRQRTKMLAIFSC